MAAGVPAAAAGDITDEIVAGLLDWVVTGSGLPAPEPPRVALVPREEIDAKAFAGENETFPHLRIEGFYDIANRTILLPDDWKADDPVARSNLLHELVHHVQLSSGLRPPCLGELEPQAYDLQISYLREQGVDDPYAALRINRITIMMASTCPDR